MKSFQLFLLVIVLAAALPACGKKEGASSKKIIGVTLLTRGHIFYRDLEEGLRKEAEARGFEVIVTAAEFDLGKQISQIEDFVTRHVSAIVVCPVDSKGITPGINRARAANIPVFTADIAAEGADVVSHIASDNIAGGRLAGEYLGKYLKGAGKIAIINQPALTSTLDRVKGFREAISKFPDIRIVSDVNGQGVRDKALSVAADVLQSHPDINGIFGINDDSALGALDAAEQFGRKDVAIIGYDATPPAVDAILRGSQLKADVTQFPKLIGSSTIDMIGKHFTGEQVPKSVPVEVGIVDKAILEKTMKK
jgi:ribose transport system substrate-binding protein